MITREGGEKEEITVRGGMLDVSERLVDCAKQQEEMIKLVQEVVKTEMGETQRAEMRELRARAEESIIAVRSAIQSLEREDDERRSVAETEEFSQSGIGRVIITGRDLMVDQLGESGIKAPDREIAHSTPKEEPLYVLRNREVIHSNP